jgi:Tfp pilus assembly protein PilN
MKSIDFLPDIYRQREALRRARLWWCIVVVIFGSAIGAAATAQTLLRSNLHRELAELEPEFAAAQAHVRELTALHAQILRASHEANLYTYLEHPWPRTQLLAEVVRPLPEVIRLSQMHVGEEEHAKGGQFAGPRGIRSDEPNAPKPSQPELDLLRLQEELDRRQTTIELDGHTTDVARLHAYMAEVNRSPLVAAAQIKSLEATPGSQFARTRFTLRLVVQPGHCQVTETVTPPSLAGGRASALRGGGG